MSGTSADQAGKEVNPGANGEDSLWSTILHLEDLQETELHPVQHDPRTKGRFGALPLSSMCCREARALSGLFGEEHCSVIRDLEPASRDHN